MTDDSLERLVRVETRAEGIQSRMDALNGQIISLNKSIHTVETKVDQVILNQAMAVGIEEALDKHGKHTLTTVQRIGAAVVAAFAIGTPIVALLLQH